MRWRFLLRPAPVAHLLGGHSAGGDLRFIINAAALNKANAAVKHRGKQGRIPGAKIAII